MAFCFEAAVSAYSQSDELFARKIGKRLERDEQPGDARANGARAAQRAPRNDALRRQPAILANKLDLKSTQHECAAGAENCGDEAEPAALKLNETTQRVARRAPNFKPEIVAANTQPFTGLNIARSPIHRVNGANDKKAVEERVRRSNEPASAVDKPRRLFVPEGEGRMADADAGEDA